MDERSVKISVPGTSANCGPGFDTLGVACTIYNEMEVTLCPEARLEIEVEGEGAGIIVPDERNIVWRSVRAVLDKAGKLDDYKGIILKMKNEVPLSRGLGSSAAAIVAGIKAANVILGNPFGQREMLQMATDIEGHPDNVAPALYGGFTISIMRNGRPECFSFMPRLNLKLVVAVPDFPLSTRMARSVLPSAVPMKDAINNIGRSSLMVAALMRGNLHFLRHAFDDALHQPYRAKLIPGMFDVFSAARRNGALGATLSGAGPCLIAYTVDNPDGIGQAMVETFKKHEIESRYVVLDVDPHGVKVIE